MLKLSKKTEYGIIALKHMLNRTEESVSSAKEIATMYNIPNEIMAKILQVLVKNDILVSSQGARGGYILARSGREISLSEIIESIEGPLGIVDCVSQTDCDCMQIDTCNISEPLKVIQKQLKIFLSGISLADINNEIEMQRVIWQ